MRGRGRQIESVRKTMGRHGTKGIVDCTKVYLRWRWRGKAEEGVGGMEGMNEMTDKGKPGRE